VGVSTIVTVVSRYTACVCCRKVIRYVLVLDRLSLFSWRCRLENLVLKCARNHNVDGGRSDVVIAYLKEPWLEMWSTGRHLFLFCFIKRSESLWCQQTRLSTCCLVNYIRCVCTCTSLFALTVTIIFTGYCLRCAHQTTVSALMLDQWPRYINI